MTLNILSYSDWDRMLLSSWQFIFYICSHPQYFIRADTKPLCLSQICYYVFLSTMFRLTSIISLEREYISLRILLNLSYQNCRLYNLIYHSVYSTIVQIFSLNYVSTYDKSERMTERITQTLRCISISSATVLSPAAAANIALYQLSFSSSISIQAFQMMIPTSNLGF